jgi:hypothetical protein
MLRSRGLVARGRPELRKRSHWRMLYVVQVAGLDGSDQGAREVEWDGSRWEIRKAL